jgi:hypothetical protein
METGQPSWNDPLPEFQLRKDAERFDRRMIQRTAAVADVRVPACPLILRQRGLDNRR